MILNNEIENLRRDEENELSRSNSDEIKASNDNEISLNDQTQENVENKKIKKNIFSKLWTSIFKRKNNSKSISNYSTEADLPTKINNNENNDDIENYDYKTSKSVSLGGDVDKQHSNINKSSKSVISVKMKNIDHNLLLNHFIKVGIECDFVNFNSRDFDVKIKQKSFEFLRKFYREFEEKLIDTQTYKIISINEFVKKFSREKLQSKELKKELKTCLHNKDCDHPQFYLLSFLNDEIKEEQVQDQDQDQDKDKEEEKEDKINEDILTMIRKQKNEKKNIKNEVNNLDDELNNELKLKLLNLDDSNIKNHLKFKIPFEVQGFLANSLYLKLKLLKEKYFSEKSIHQILLQIDFKKIKVSELSLNFFDELTEYLNKFFKWNLSYELYLEHIMILKEFFISISSEIKKYFYDFFLRKNTLIFKKKELYLVIFLINIIKQFRWNFNQVFYQIIKYGSCKGI